MNYILIVIIIVILYVGVYYIKHRPNGRYVTISKSSGYLELLQVEAYDTDGNLLKPVNVVGSDDIKGSDKDVVSCIVDRNFSKNKTFLTGSGDIGKAGSRFATIDYGKLVNISKIVVYLKKCCYRNIMSGTVVSVRDENGKDVFSSYPFPDVSRPSRIDTPERVGNFFEPGNDVIPYQAYVITTTPLPFYSKLPVGLM